MRTKFFAIVAVLGLSFVSASRAQDPAPAPPPSGPVVGLSLIVTDKDGKGVNSIGKDQLRVFEDKVEQTILSLEADVRPVDYILLIDSTGSFKYLFGSALEAAKLFVLNRRPEDQVAICRFISSDKIETVQEFTADGDTLLKAVNDSYLEMGQSAVIDALYLSADYVNKHNKGNAGRRKVVITITDGEDRISYYKQKDLRKLLDETGVQMFFLGLVVDLSKDGRSMQRPSPRVEAEELLTAVATDSGGRVFFPETKEQLVAAAADIIYDLRAQFRIKYQSTHDGSKKGFRKVDVKFVGAEGDEKRNLVTPRGYYVGPKPPAKSEKKKS